MRKTEVLTVRVTPEFKRALRELAVDSRRSQANFLENLVLECWSARGRFRQQAESGSGADRTNRRSRSLP